MDSAEIAKYLDDEYPETPAVLPKEVRAYQVGPIHTLFTLWRKSDLTHRPPSTTSSGSSRVPRSCLSSSTVSSPFSSQRPSRTGGSRARPGSGESNSRMLARQRNMQSDGPRPSVCMA